MHWQGDINKRTEGFVLLVALYVYDYKAKCMITEKKCFTNIYLSISRWTVKLWKFSTSVFPCCSLWNFWKKNFPAMIFHTSALFSLKLQALPITVRYSTIPTTITRVYKLWISFTWIVINVLFILSFFALKIFTLFVSDNPNYWLPPKYDARFTATEQSEGWSTIISDPSVKSRLVGNLRVSQLKK